MVLRCKRITNQERRFHQLFRFKFHSSIPHWNFSNDVIIYIEKGKQTLLNFAFPLNLLKSLPCWYVKHIMFLLFCILQCTSAASSLFSTFSAFSCRSPFCNRLVKFLLLLIFWEFSNLQLKTKVEEVLKQKSSKRLSYLQLSFLYLTQKLRKLEFLQDTIFFKYPTLTSWKVHMVHHKKHIKITLQIKSKGNWKTVRLKGKSERVIDFCLMVLQVTFEMG